MDDSQTTCKKFKYTPPASPSPLIDSTTLVIDFVNRKFVHIGFDPSGGFNVVLHIITPSRYISITPEEFTIFNNLMSDFLTAMLDTPDKMKKITFYDGKTSVFSKTIYRGENMLVMESKEKDGCRVLLDFKDLQTLIRLEWSIVEAISRKTENTCHTLKQQIYQVLNFFKEEETQPITVEEFKKNVSRTEDDVIITNIRKPEHCLISQIKTFALDQLAERWLREKEFNEPNTQPNFSSCQPRAPDSCPLVIDENIKMSPPTYQPPQPSHPTTPSSSQQPIDVNDGPAYFDLYNMEAQFSMRHKPWWETNN